MSCNRTNISSSNKYHNNTLTNSLTFKNDAEWEEKQLNKE